MDLRNASFVVQTTKGCIVDGFGTIEHANAAAGTCNKRAEQMGITTRYEATTNPMRKEA